MSADCERFLLSEPRLCDALVSAPHYTAWPWVVKKKPGLSIALFTNTNSNILSLSLSPKSTSDKQQTITFLHLLRNELFKENPRAIPLSTLQILSLTKHCYWLLFKFMVSKYSPKAHSHLHLLNT